MHLGHYRKTICKVIDSLIILFQNGDLAPSAFLGMKGKYHNVFKLCLGMSHDIVVDCLLLAL